MTTPTETTIQLAEKFCDVSIDSKGRKSFEFDSHGLAEFVAAVECQERKSCANWLRRNANAEKGKEKREAFIEAHNAIMSRSTVG